MMTDTELRNRAGERLDHTFHPGTRADVLVILGHGVTANKDRPHLVAIAEGLAARGWPCLRVSFSGNGESEGRFEDSTITKEISDLQAVLDTVPDTAGIAYIGHSMGGAVGVLTAVRDMRIRALVSLAGMTHTAEFVAREFGDVTPDQGVMWDDDSCPLSSTFVNDMQEIGSTLDAAAEIIQPWLLIHGTADDVVPIQDSRDVLKVDTCKNELIEIPDAGHSFDEASYQQLVDAIDAHLMAVFT